MKFDTKKFLFDTFSATKVAGLGLSISYQIFVGNHSEV